MNDATALRSWSAVARLELRGSARPLVLTDPPAASNATRDTKQTRPQGTSSGTPNHVTTAPPWRGGIVGAEPTADIPTRPAREYAR